MIEKNKPEIRFEGFTDEWKEIKLGDICHIGDIDHKMPQSVTEGIPYVMTGDFTGMNGINFEKAKLISFIDYEQLSRKIKPEVGDILFARYASVGSVRYVETQMKFLISYSCAIIKRSNAVNGKFLFYYLRTNEIKRQIELQINTGSQRNIGIDSLKKLIIFLPSKKEQDKLEKYLTSIDQLINLRQCKYDKLITLKKAMLDKMFPENGKGIPKIRFKGFFGTWNSLKLGEIGDTYTGLSGKTKDDFGHGEGRFITYMNVFTNTIASEDATELVEIDSKQNEVKKGDVFFTTSSEVPEEVGMSSVWLSNNINTYLNSFCFGYRPKVKIDNYYLAYMLHSTTFRKKITFLAQGISRYNISKKKVMEIVVSLPSLNEQEKIGNYFKNLDDLITLQHTQLDKLKNIKRSSIDKMFV